MTDLLALTIELTNAAKAANGSVYDAAFEKAHDYVSPYDGEAEEHLATIAFHLTNLANAIKAAQRGGAIAAIEA